MSFSSPNASQSEPLACTLSAVERQARRAWIGGLSEYLLSRAPTTDGALLRFRASPETEQQLRALVAAEARCCPFLDFELSSNESTLELTIRGPNDARVIIDELFDGSRVE